jgi:hypothetical protein
VHGCKTLGRLAQDRFEVANAQPGQGGLYSRKYLSRSSSVRSWASSMKPISLCIAEELGVREQQDSTRKMPKPWP